MKPLHHDVTRCYGSTPDRHDCARKETCSRFKTMEVDEPRPLSYMQDMRDKDGACRFWIGVRK